MCVLAFAHGMDARWPLVLAGNRDERHDRAAGPLRRWPGAEHILAGQDLTAGGLWLGVSEACRRLVTVTNVRAAGGPVMSRPSRGQLCLDVLEGRAPTEPLAAYGPFNLVILEPGAARLWSNRPEPAKRDLPPGLYGLANGPLDEDAARATALKAAIADWLASGDDDLAPLLAALADDRPFDVADAYGGAPVFLRDPVYGTRCSTVVRVGAERRGEIVERRFEASGAPIGETALAFSWV